MGFLIRIVVVLSVIVYVSAKSSNSMTCSCIRKITTVPAVTTTFKSTISTAAATKASKYFIKNASKITIPKYIAKKAPKSTTPKSTISTTATATTSKSIIKTAATIKTSIPATRTTTITATQKFTSSKAMTTIPIAKSSSTDIKISVTTTSFENIIYKSTAFDELSLLSTSNFFVGLGIVSGILTVGIFVHRFFSIERGVYSIIT